MLSPEVARKRLEPLRVESEDRFLCEAAKLPKRLRPIGYALLDRDADGQEFRGRDWQENQRLEHAALAPVDSLEARERLAVWSAFFGALAPDVEIAWQFLKKTPYQTGYARKAFRAAHNPEATFAHRIDWLKELISLAEHYRSDVLTPTWLAAWVPHLAENYRSYEDCLGRLLAAVVDAGGTESDAVFDILCQSARNEHEIGAMGRHVIRAVLLASRDEGWELIEKMLLAAQRQEGLRQSILETIGEAHPRAFQRMLRLIRDHDLARFSSVVRAANVWFGLGWDSVSVKTVNQTIDQVLTFLEDPASRKKALAGKDPEGVFLALWSMAFEDALAAIPVAAGLLDHKEVEVRFVSALHLSQLALPQTHAPRLKALDDADLRVALCSLAGSGPLHEEGEPDELQEGRALFDALQRLFERLPARPAMLKPLVWPWAALKASREEVAGHLVTALGRRPPTLLLPYLPAINPWTRRMVIELLSAQKKWDKLTRAALIGLAGDASSDVRQAAFQSLQKARLEPPEILRLESLLTRKAADLRQGVIQLLQKPGAGALASADRLTQAPDSGQRLAGLELLRQMAEANCERDVCIERGTAYRVGRKKLSQEEQTQISAICESRRERLTLDNALGLLNPSKRSPTVMPQRRKVQFVTRAALACLQELDELVHQHRESSIKFKNWRGEEQEALLGNIDWGFPSPDWTKPPDQTASSLPLREVWEAWYANRPQSTRDADGFELLRARLWRGLADDWEWELLKQWAGRSSEEKAAATELTGGHDRSQLRYEGVVNDLVNWLLYLYQPAGMVDFLLDAVETSFALVPGAEMAILAKWAKPGPDAGGRGDNEKDWREAKPFEIWLEELDRIVNLLPDRLSPDQATRRWALLHWWDEPFPGAPRKRAAFEVVADAYHRGAATLADVADHLMGPRGHTTYGHESFDSLRLLTERKLDKQHLTFLADHPEVRDLVERCRSRLLAIELARGEAATEATAPALNIRSFWGSETLFQIVAALGKQGFKSTGWRSSEESKPGTLTQLASVTYPVAADTPETFTARALQAAAEGTITEQTLLQLAFLAPQWAGLVEAHLAWPGFSEALYWFLAHMRYVWQATERAAVGAGLEDAEPAGDQDSDGKTKRSGWERLIAERTPLPEDERAAGAVDVRWFQRTYQAITPKRWQAMADAARFAANASQARRAQFVADVLTGKASRNELVLGVTKKKLKDYVRLLGLYPLAQRDKRAADLAERYRVLQGYRKYAKQLSAVTKPEALRAVEIGMQNLASTAGYPDPLRLEWAMEAEQVRDLARGPISVTRAGVTVTLSLDDQSQPQVSVRRGDKALKAIPPAVKKDRRVAEITERATDLKRQASRMKQSLETAMFRGDTFSGDELSALCGHAILAPLLNRLVLVGDGILGYPDKGGKTLRGHDGKHEPVKKNELVRIAHAHDLLATGAWDEWQHECFRSERVQPFKQVFRELYVVTKQEKQDGTMSRRYAGQQVNPQQAYALWGQRGWGTQDGVWKTIHELGITASVSFNYGVTTPLDVEGLTIDGVQFCRQGEYKPLKLVDVPPRIFSEVMRDVDLVVSVAHRGAVDPEASASTVAMRANLLRETCDLLQIDNVRCKNNHALIDGELANYSVHLGSTTVHRLPGGAVCIVPVHGRHRGRLFLPFADDDPRTAEVISKVILLARDSEIQDPTILEQLRR